MRLGHKVWKPGDFVFINKLQWGKPEVENVMDVFEQDWFGAGDYNLKLENKLKEFSGLKHVQTVNSGSAAIQIAIQTLMQKGIWKPGDKILHPINTFATSISSAIMAGLIPVYVDIDIGTYVISTEGMKKAFHDYPDLKGAIIPALLGNVPDMDVLLNGLNGKPLILDSCDVMGSQWQGQEVAGMGTFGAFSFYGSHHISAFGVGGAIGTQDDEYAEMATSLTFWGRNFSSLEGMDDTQKFLHRYYYLSLGLDAQMTNVQAAFALAQMERLPKYIDGRQFVFSELQKLFVRYQDWFIQPIRSSDKADVSWFCYPLTIKEGAPFTRNEFVKYLLEHLVEIRPIMCPVITKQTPFGNAPHIISGDFPNARLSEKGGLFIPAFPMPLDEMAYYFDTLKTFLSSQEKK